MVLRFWTLPLLTPHHQTINITTPHHQTINITTKLKKKNNCYLGHANHVTGTLNQLMWILNCIWEPSGLTILQFGVIRQWIIAEHYIPRCCVWCCWRQTKLWWCYSIIQDACLMIRYQLETVSALLAFVRGSHRSRWIPLTKACDTELRCFCFDLRLNKRLSKQSRRRWFEMPSRSLWRHCNVVRLSVCTCEKSPLVSHTN